MFTKRYIKNFLAKRNYTTSMTTECEEFIKKLGITSTEIVHNPSVGRLYEYAMMDDHLHSVDPSVHQSTITDSGALSCSSGLRTGRSPKDKRIVYDDETKDIVNWGKVNIPIIPQSFMLNRQRAIDFLKI
jgi:phosphoenolpyruvate carboxykinase (ATP)